MEIVEGAGRVPDLTAAAAGYVERLRVPELSFGTAVIPAGAVEPAKAHAEDEVYVVLAGRATMAADSGRAPVVPGDIVFVRAGERHHFVDIVEPLYLIALFAPAYESVGV